MIEEVCMIATDVNPNLNAVILIDTLLGVATPRDACSCHTNDTDTGIGATCIGVRTICSTTRISL